MSFHAEQPQNPYASPTADSFRQQAAESWGKRHSGLGIASFVIALGGGVGEFALVVITAVLMAHRPGRVNPPAVTVILLGLGILGGIALHFVGVGLGIAALFQRDRTKIFAILGLIFNALVVISICGMMAIGMVVG